MNAMSHIEVVNEASACIRMETTIMLRSEVTGLNRIINDPALHEVTKTIARAMLDAALVELERREAASGVARETRT